MLFILDVIKIKFTFSVEQKAIQPLKILMSEFVKVNLPQPILHKNYDVGLLKTLYASRANNNQNRPNWISFHHWRYPENWGNFEAQVETILYCSNKFPYSLLKSWVSESCDYQSSLELSSVCIGQWICFSCGLFNFFNRAVLFICLVLPLM